MFFCSRAALRAPTALSLVLLAACSGTASEPSQPVSPPAAPTAAPSQQAAAPVAKSAPAASSESAGGLVWEGKAPLVKRAPKNSMRAGEYGLEFDPQAELTVFYFGADQGGSVDANIARWLGQFTQPDGSNTADKAVREQRAIGGVTVTTIETTGTFGGGMAMPGAQATGAVPEAMLLGAIANGPKGPVFFKLVGGRSSVERAREGFNSLLESIRIDPALVP